MQLLLDTHIFLWYVTGDTRLSAATCDAINDPNNDVFLSVGSFWEIVIKYELGKLPLPQAPDRFIPAQRKNHGIQSLPFDENDARFLVGLPFHHRDPFDRMLVSQAMARVLTIATVDPEIKKYSVPVL
ncbi:MAG TPA: type II toxin-antitoxin system VapC family toxin [Pyrinomonadaceae bacterium]|nr:type II toxin-antitoxin system VapC family toxin [Pyrinomonadaceae bacterium]